MKLSTSTCDLRGHAPGTDGTLRLAAQTSFKHFNVYFSGADERLNGPDWEEKIERVRLAAQETKANPVLAHAVCGSVSMDYDKLVEESARGVIACERLGIADIVVHPLYDLGRSPMGIFELNRKFYQDIYSLCPDTAVHILTENTGEDDTRGTAFFTGIDLRDFLEYVGEPRLGVCWDTAHGSLCSSPRDNQYENITVLGKYLRALHVSDNFSNGLHWHSFPFSGIVNFDSILCALIDIDYKGYFNFEAPYIVRPAYSCPLVRNEWKHPTREDHQNLLSDPPLKLVMMAEELLYETGKYMLEKYGIFEE